MIEALQPYTVPFLAAGLVLLVVIVPLETWPPSKSLLRSLPWWVQVGAVAVAWLVLGFIFTDA